jgi:hypothetical protein
VPHYYYRGSGPVWHVQMRMPHYESSSFGDRMSRRGHLRQMRTSNARSCDAGSSFLLLSSLTDGIAADVLLEKSPLRKVQSTRPHATVSNAECPLGCVGDLTTRSSIHPVTTPHALLLEKLSCSNAYVCSLNGADLPCRFSEVAKSFDPSPGIQFLAGDGRLGERWLGAV